MKESRYSKYVVTNFTPNLGKSSHRTGPVESIESPRRVDRPIFHLNSGSGKHYVDNIESS
jgi:hypothetical protein